MKNLFKLTRLCAVSLLLLFGFTQQAWANKGFFTDGQWNVQYYSSGSSSSWMAGNYKNGSTQTLGVMSTFYLKGCWVKTYGDENVYNVTFHYGYTDHNEAGNYTMHYNESNWSQGYKGDYTWTFDNKVDYNVIENAPNKVGANTLWVRWSLDGGAVTSGTSYINFTIPGFTTTSTSKSYTAVVNNNSSQTISFGTHYGTTLSTSNCSITGTNSSDFTVTGISESGVTVKFAPSTVGKKSATLTITDAHSKTCTISLTGTATPTAVTGFTQSVTDKLSGNGSNSDPYIIKYNTNVTVSLTADKWSDGNAALQFKVGSSGSWTAATNGTTGTATIKTTNTSTTDNVTIYYRYYNSANSIAGAESSTTIYYKSASYSVTLNANGGTITDGKDITSYTYGVGATLPIAPSEVSRAGYDFDGWFLNDGGEAVTEIGTSEYGDKSYTAHWTQNIQYYKLTLSIGIGGSLTSVKDNEGNIIDPDNVVGGTTIIVTVTPESGYEVDTWTCGEDSQIGEDTYTTTISAPTEIGVTFKETKYSVTISKGTGIQSVTPSSPQQVGNVTEKTVTATLTPGYTIADWTYTGGINIVSGQGTNSISVKATAAGTITANATENMTTVSVGVNDVNMGSVDKSNVSVGVATTATLTATKKPGYKFKMWTLGDGATLYSGSLSEATITIKGSGVAGSTGTATATFEEDLSSGVYLQSNGITPQQWQDLEAYEFKKISGQSTSNDVYLTITTTEDEQYKYVNGGTDNNQFILHNNHGADNKHILSKTDGYWFVNSYAINTTLAPFASGDTYQNMRFFSTVPGTYTFHYNLSTRAFDITYPDQYSIQICDAGGQWTAHNFVDNSVNISLDANKDIRFRVVYQGAYYGNEGTMTNVNCTGWTMENNSSTRKECWIKTVKAGSYTFSFDPSTKKLTVTYPGEEHHTVIVDNGESTKEVDVKEVTETEISAPQYLNGLRFDRWIATNSTGGDESENITINHPENRVTHIKAAKKEGIIVRATYNSDYMVYFKNTPGWGDVHVFFYTVDKHWKDNGTGVKYYDDNEKKWVQIATGHHMTRLNDKSDIWYYDYSGVSDVHGAIAFNDHDQYDYEYFANCQAAYRTDWDRGHNLSVFVPEKNISEKKNNNTAAYYNKGYWMKYDDLKTGYYLRVKDKTESGTDYEFKAASAGEPYKATITLEGSQTKEFWINGVNGSAYKNTGTMTSSGSHSGWEFYEGNQDNCKITTTSAGDYTFTLTFGEGMLLVSVEYPLSENDYRVVYTDNSHPCHPSTFIRKGDGNKDIVSFFIDRTEGKNPALKFQYCSKISGSTVTWTDVEGGTIDISGITATGIYNFNLEQDANSISCTGHELYDGDFYIRTAIAAGGWDAYKGSADNLLPYIKYGLDESQPFKFTHAYTNWVEKDKNVKFCIANDYSLCISDTLVGDDIIGKEENADWLKNGANIRFMWNKNTNALSRAYISGSTNDEEKYLMLINTNKKMYNIPAESEEPVQIDELKFTDKNNWVYQADIKAKPGCEVKLTAQYTIGSETHTQYFMGTESTTRTIISGSATDKQYTMRVVYDFKTNRLTAGWVPDGTEISSEIKLGGDMLLVREHQGDANQITFSGSGKVSDIHHIYGVLTLKKDLMAGTAKEEYKDKATNADFNKTMFWISFPFDVNISEIFGVDGYGKKWIMQKYRGDLRAQKGWFAETSTFWEYMDISEKLNAYEGYLFIVDANYFNTTDADVWKNSATEANFYFPSAEKNIGIINQASVTITVPEHECKINRWFGTPTSEHPEGALNHTITDSHWNVIGVPTFQNSTASTISEKYTNFKSYYAWVPTTNSYSAQAALGTGITFNTMQAYMVQYAGTITWENVSVVSKAPYAYADDKNYMIELFLGNTEAEDHTYINLADEASTDFVLNEDMMKIDNAGFPNIYSFAGAYDVAYNETTFDNQMVVLGVSAPKDGSYTFAMPKDFSGKAVLVDLESGEATDLNLSNYTVELNKGTYNNRFQLLLEVEAKAPTNMNPTKGEWSEDGKTKKLLINSNIYLINAGRIYNASGTQVK